MEIMTDIINGLKYQSLLIERYYYMKKDLITNNLKEKKSCYKDYEQVNIINEVMINSLLDKLKYIMYSIFDSKVRRRLETTEMMKNHQISRRLCNHFSSLINSGEDANLEAHFGYDVGYYWVPLYESNNGIINAPKSFSFCTRLFPIYCHEVSHPIIDKNWASLLNDEIFQRGFIVTYDYITKHLDTRNIDYKIKESIAYASNVYSEILADLISSLICKKSFSWAFSSSLLFPINKIHADSYFIYGMWQSHPPNILRFQLCNHLLELCGYEEDAKLLENNWVSIQNLQDDHPVSSYVRQMDEYVQDFMMEFDLNAICKRFLEEDSPIYVETCPVKENYLENLDYSSTPIEILNAIWNTRLSRYRSNQEDYNRESAQVLKYLYYSLERESL